MERFRKRLAGPMILAHVELSSSSHACPVWGGMLNADCASMKTAYELAMERLNKTSPTVKLTDEQKKEIAELESQCRAKLADRELFLQGEMAKAIDRGDEEAVAQFEKQLVSDRKSLRAEYEEKKEKVRSRGAK